MPYPESSTTDKSSASLVRSRARRWLRILQWSAVSLLLFYSWQVEQACSGCAPSPRHPCRFLMGIFIWLGFLRLLSFGAMRHGVPHIDAATQEDLFFAQGYVTAQDRLWQMDVLRRNANGDLAEVMGRSLVRHDTVQRVFQFRNTAQRIYANLAGADRTRLDAYARGVNQFIVQHRMRFLRNSCCSTIVPSHGSGADSLSIGVAMMAQTLDDHWDAKLAREQIAARLHNSKLEADLYPVGSWRDHPPTGLVVDLTQPHPIPPSHDDDEDDDRTQTRVTPHEDMRMLHTLLRETACADCVPGSNQWVIAGRYTASGKPLLSNDMHLALTVPNIWYMADLRAPGFHAAGVALAGVPFVAAGHNDHLAWGYTALYADVQDLYVEKLDGKGNYKAIDGSWKPLSVDHETIYVRGAKDVIVNVQSTAHGPLLNPLFTKETRPMALKWTLYDATLNTLPIFQLDTAASCAEATAALSTWSSPTLNVIYADDQGHIAYHAVGRVPLRPSGFQECLSRMRRMSGRGTFRLRAYRMHSIRRQDF